MRAFACPHCRALVFFDSTSCVRCGRHLGFVRAAAEMRELAADGCRHRERLGCNWLVEPGAPDGQCSSCRLTRTRPNDADTAGMAAWAETEAAKRHLLYQLDDLGLPVENADAPPLTFDLLSSAYEPVTTGHADGVITIDLAEGSDPHREALRIQLGEAYRTLLGHLRHEVGHWYWTVLIENRAAWPGFRAMFGDEQRDYADALQAHYAGADDRSWVDTHVSFYAAAHPWEDWAETFAHYLHIRDTFETAQLWRLSVDGPDAGIEHPPVVDTGVDAGDFDALLANWGPLTITLNALNRSMGRADLYPFALPPAVQEKLRFVHSAIAAAGQSLQR